MALIFALICVPSGSAKVPAVPTVRSLASATAAEPFRRTVAPETLRAAPSSLLPRFTFTSSTRRGRSVRKSTSLEGSDACFAPVLSMNEAPQHPHNRARRTFVEDGGVVQPAPAPRFDRTQGELPPKAPRTGQHTRELLQRAGLDVAQIDALLREGVAFEGKA